MSDSCLECGESDEQRPAPESLSRSSFMRRVGVAAGLLLGAGTGGLRDVFSPIAALAAGKAKAAATAPGLLLGNIKGLKPNAALTYTDPKSGDPAVLIRLANGQVVSYDAVCTHAGCTVPYYPARRLLVCPCHGARYDPARGAAVVGGPAPQPLSRLPIQVDVAGNVYALDAKPGTARAANRLHVPSPITSSGEDANDDGGRSRRRRPGRTGGDD